MIKALLFANAVCSTQASNSTDSGCTKDGCPFSYYNGGRARCGEVDAAPRMPADIWNDPTAVEEYVKLTESLYLLYPGMKQEPCNQSWTQHGEETVPWTNSIFMATACDERCHCRYPECKDVPDDPKDHHYCSLCGPKFNAPIKVKFYEPSGPAPGPSPGPGPAPGPSPGTVCKATEYCCPDAKKCLTPTSTSCLFDANACSSGQVCCPLTKICVIPGADCKTPCADQGTFCCPDAKACLTPVEAKVGLFCDPSRKDACAAGEVCCPLIKECVTVGAKCTAP